MIEIVEEDHARSVATMEHGEQRERDEGSLACMVGRNVLGALKVKIQFTPDNRVWVGWMFELGRLDDHPVDRRNESSQGTLDAVECLVVRKFQRGERDRGLCAVLGNGGTGLITVGARCDLIRTKPIKLHMSH